MDERYRLYQHGDQVIYQVFADHIPPIHAIVYGHVSGQPKHYELLKYSGGQKSWVAAEHQMKPYSIDDLDDWLTRPPRAR